MQYTRLGRIAVLQIVVLTLCLSTYQIRVRFQHSDRLSTGGLLLTCIRQKKPGKSKIEFCQVTNNMKKIE